MDKSSDSTALTKPSKAAVAWKAVKSGLAAAKDMAMNPIATWESIKEVAHHYWVGSKLLWSEMKLTREILGRVVRGHEMTRRERRQLIRTTMDMFRLVPFAVFVIVPFMEFLLPFALKLFPNMLPSTFQDSMKEEENLKKELQMRLAVAKFFQDTMQEMANKKAKVAQLGPDGKPLPNPDAHGANELLDFVESAQKGRAISNDVVIKMAKHFKDELTLPNIARPQLVSMCRYMGISPYGSDSILRFQLRNKIRATKEDDRRILWEGVDSLNTLELREACRERGMRSSGLTQFKLKSQLQEWLELSTQKGIPISLLIMSRAFNLTTATDEPEEVLKSSMSALDADTINEIIVATATGSEADSLEMRRRKLESLKFQQEMIAEEIGKNEVKKKAAPAAVAALPATRVPAVETGASEEGSAGAEAGAQTKHTVELTVREIQALADLARGSSLQREKAELQMLQATIEALLVSAQSSAPTRGGAAGDSASRGPTVPVTEETASRSMQRLQSVLQSMLSKLQLKLDSSEKAVGERFNLLDRDGDGRLTAEELRDAIVLLLRRNFSLQEAEGLVSLLDSDQDGKISLPELLAYIEKQKEALELRDVDGGELDASREAAAVVAARSAAAPHS